jgi:hypothetical protein
LHTENVTADFAIQSTSGGWQYFSVAFAPRLVSRERVVAAIEAGGGEVVPGAPEQ